jgi:hypothetical protein
MSTAGLPCRSCAQLSLLPQGPPGNAPLGKHSGLSKMPLAHSRSALIAEHSSWPPLLQSTRQVLSSQTIGAESSPTARLLHASSRLARHSLPGNDPTGKHAGTSSTLAQIKPGWMSLHVSPAPVGHLGMHAPPTHVVLSSLHAPSLSQSAGGWQTEF